MVHIYMYMQVYSKTDWLWSKVLIQVSTFVFSGTHDDDDDDYMDMDDDPEYGSENIEKSPKVTHLYGTWC